jgi:hypothetical protein
MKTGTLKGTSIKCAFFLLIFISSTVDTFAMDSMTSGNSMFSLPIVKEFKGNSDGKMVMLSWKLDVPTEELSGKTYSCQLQRANEDNRFVTIQELENLNVTDYSFNDQLAGTSKNLYRLVLTSSEGQRWTSNVLSFNKAANAMIRDLKVYPTVVSYSQFTINIPSERKQQGSVQMVNYAGQVVYEKQLTLSAGTNSISISGFSPSLQGNHILVVKAGGENYRGKILIENTSGYSK